MPPKNSKARFGNRSKGGGKGRKGAGGRAYGGKGAGERGYSRRADHRDRDHRPARRDDHDFYGDLGPKLGDRGVLKRPIPMGYGRTRLVELYCYGPGPSASNRHPRGRDLFVTQMMEDGRYQCRVARMGSWDYTEVLMRSRFGTVDDKN